MADTKISDETAASALTGPELLLGVQGGANVKITATQLATHALVANRDTDVTLAADSDNKFPTQKAVKAHVAVAVAGVTVTNITGNAGTATALQTARTIDGVSFNGTNNIDVLAPATHAATSKAAPVDADALPLVDSEDSNGLKKLTWANVKAALKTYFDTLYRPKGPTVVSITYAGTISVDLTGQPDGVTFRCALTGNVTVNFTGGTDGQKCTVELAQDATGSRLVTLGSAVGYGTDIASFTATTTASKADVLGFVYHSGAAKYRLVAVAKGY